MEKCSASSQFLCTACRHWRKKYLEASEMKSQRVVRSERSFWKVIQEMQLKLLELDKTPTKLPTLQISSAIFIRVVTQLFPLTRHLHANPTRNKSATNGIPRSNNTGLLDHFELVTQSFSSTFVPRCYRLKHKFVRSDCS